MPDLIVVEPLSDIPIRVERLSADAPRVIALQGIPGPPGKISMATNAILFIIDGGQGPFLPGDKADFPIPFNGIITGWQAIATPAGNVTVDILKTPFADFPPEPGDSITNGDLAGVVNSRTGEGDAATWETGLSEGDVLSYEVVTNDIVRRLSVALFVERD